MEQQTKICRKCQRILPVTTEYFFRRAKNKDGFHNQCKECEGYKFGIYIYNKQDNLDDEHKICSKCQRQLPATTDYFNKNKNRFKELTSRCKECLGSHFPEKIEEGFKRCSICHEILPMTDQYFYKNNIVKCGYKSYCIQCSKTKYKKDSLKRHEEYLRNKDQYKISSKIYYLDNIEKCRIYVRKRRSLKKKLLSTFTKKDWQECKEYFSHQCAYCGKSLKSLTQDHIVPISKNGPYTKQNIIPACGICNSSKSNSDMETWYHQQPFFSQERLSKIYDWMGVKDGIQQLKII